MVARIIFGWHPDKYLAAVMSSFLLYGLIGCRVSAATDYQESTGLKCNFDIVYKRALAETPEIKAIIAALEPLAAKCAGSSDYVVRMADLYMDAGYFDKAEKTFLSGLELNSPQKKNIMFGLSSVYVRKGDFRSANRYADRLLREYPDWFGSHSAKATSLIFGDSDYVKATSFFVRSNELADKEEDSLAILSNDLLLSVCFYNQGKFRESAMSLQSAFKINRGLAMTDTPAVAAGAASLLELGFDKEAAELVEIHYKFLPDSMRDEFFKKVYSAALDSVGR